MCELAALGADDAAFGLDILETRGFLTPGSAEEEEFIKQSLIRTAADAATFARFNLIDLKKNIQQVLTSKTTKIDFATRAHLTESVARIDETLKAQQQRALR